MISRTQPLSGNRVAHYLEQGNGEPLVLIHGVGMQAMAWYPQIEFFSPDYKVISVDIPGHGESTRFEGEVELKHYVLWMIEFIERLLPGGVNLAGHSMGSLIAVGVAVERPDLVRRIAVINGVYRRTAQARDAVIQRARELKHGGVDIFAPLYRWFNQTDVQRPVIDQVRGWLEQVDLAGYAAAYSAFARGDDLYADRWQEIACPALILTGADDPNSTAVMADQMASLAQNARAVVVQNERHMVNLTDPEAVNQEMKSWLETPP